MAKKIKLSEQGLKKLAKTFKYTGDMSKFKDFLASDPAKQHLVNNYLKKVMKAAKGGVVGYNTGGMTQVMDALHRVEDKLDRVLSKD